MKRAVRMLAAAVLTVGLLSVEALGASAGTYTLEPLSMEITVPEGLRVFLRDTVETDPDVEALEVDGPTLTQVMEEQAVYLTAMSEDLGWEIGVSMSQEEDFQKIFDFNLYGEELLDGMTQVMLQGASEEGYTFYNQGAWQGEQALFAVVDSTQTQEEAVTYRRQYYTIFNGQAINVVLVSYGGALTSEQTEALESMVESIAFTEVLPVPEEARRTAEEAKALPEAAGARRGSRQAQGEGGGYGVMGQAVGVGLAAGLLTWALNRKKLPTAGEAGGEEREEK